MNPSLKKFLQIVIPLVAGLVILYLLFQGESAKYAEDCALKGIPAEDCSLLQKIWLDIVNADYFWVFAVVFAFMVSNIARALRWQMLLKPLDVNASFGNSFWTLMAGYLVNLGIPRTGEFARAGLLAKYEDASFDKVFGTIVTGRLIDVLFLIIVIILSLLLEYDRIWGFISDNVDIASKLSVFTDQPILIAVVLLILAGLAYLAWRLLQTSEFFIFVKIRSFLSGLFEGILSIRKVESPILFVGYSVVIWICYFLMTYWGFFTFEPTAHLDAGAGLVSFVLGTLGIVFPSPGGMGSYHFLIMEALNIYGVASTNAFSFANILYFSIQIFGNILFGIAAFVVLPIINRKA